MKFPVYFAPKVSLNQFLLGIIALSLAVIAAAETGIIRPAHALNVNAAVRILNKSIADSEDRVLKEIQKQCGGTAQKTKVKKKKKSS